jgi:hemolysin activation/secretion protein
MTAACAVLLLSAAVQQLPPGTPGSQTGQVEQSLRPRTEPAWALERAPIERTAPPPVKQMEGEGRLRVRRIVLSGCEALSGEELRPALPPEGEAERSVAELRAVADRITAIYHARGYAWAVAYVPPQEATDGVVEIAVREGRIGRVRVDGNRYYGTGFILDHLQDVEAPAPLNLPDLERGLRLLNDIPALRVDAALQPGELPGSIDVQIRAEDRLPMTVEVGYDNYGSETVGRDRGGAAFGAHNLWGAGHSLSVRGMASLNAREGELGFVRADYVIPFGAGTRLRAYAAAFDFDADEDRAVLEPAGDGTVLGLSASHALVRSYGLSVWAELGYESKSLTQELIGLETARDELRIALVALRLEWAEGAGGRWDVVARLRQGLGDVGGGLGNNDPDASRSKADGDFTILELQAWRYQRVTDGIQLMGRLRAQWAGEPLVVSEQFALGGHDSVRGYPPFESAGDRGYAASLEARFKLPFLEGIPDPFGGEGSAVDLFQVAGFIDTGKRVREQAVAPERRSQALTGAGVGLRVESPGVFSLHLDVAWPISEADPSDGEDLVVYLSLILRIR